MNHTYVRQHTTAIYITLVKYQSMIYVPPDDPNKACEVLNCGENAKCLQQGNNVKCECEEGYVGNPNRLCESKWSLEARK